MMLAWSFAICFWNRATESLSWVFFCSSLSTLAIKAETVAGAYNKRARDRKETESAKAATYYGAALKP
jgi:hypothetical protein